ncbi:MAG: hypothetical protein WCJ36_00465 [Candidatus Saccharibacteria bacterium]
MGFDIINIIVLSALALVFFIFYSLKLSERKFGASFFYLGMVVVLFTQAARVVFTRVVIITATTPNIKSLAPLDTIFGWLMALGVVLIVIGGLKSFRRKTTKPAHIASINKRDVS